jgi:hypothetical protein
VICSAAVGENGMRPVHGLVGMLRGYLLIELHAQAGTVGEFGVSGLDYGSMADS